VHTDFEKLEGTLLITELDDIMLKSIAVLTFTSTLSNTQP